MSDDKETHSIIIFIIFLIGFLSIIFLTLILWRSSVLNKIDNHIAELKRKGYPVTLEELNKFYKEVPDDENAALLYEEAESKFYEDYSIIDDFTDYKAKYLESNQAITKEQIENYSAYIADNKDVLNLVKQAGKLEESRYDTDFTKGWDAQLPELGSYKDINHLLSMQILLDVNNDNYKNIEILLYHKLKLIKSLEKYPCLISHLVNLAISKTFIDDIRMLLDKGVFTSEKELDLIHLYLEKLLNKDGLKFAYIGEINVCFDTTKNPSVILLGTAYDNVYLRTLLYYLLTWDAELMLKYHRKLIDIHSKERSLDNLRKGEKIHLEIENIRKNSYKFNYYLFKMLMPGLKSMSVKDFDHYVKISLAQTAMQIEKYYLKNRKYPDTLKELSNYKNLLLDPYSEKPFLYKKINNKSYKLYSIGRNLIDDGGVPITLNKNKDQDIVFFINKE